MASPGLTPTDLYKQTLSSQNIKSFTYAEVISRHTKNICAKSCRFHRVKKFNFEVQKDHIESCVGLPRNTSSEPVKVTESQ